MKQKVTILGAGESGVGAALLAKEKGTEVFVSDSGEISQKYIEILNQNQIEYEKGKHSEDHILTSDLIIKSPGIPDKAPLIKKIKEKEIPMISEIEYGAWYSQAKFVGITGSNGKTTTTLLTYHLLKNIRGKTGLAGNIGDSLAKQVINDENDLYVLELSSFQLDYVFRFSPHIAVLLNITPDHLDRYENKFENYVDSKFRIMQNLSKDDYFIYFGDDEVIAEGLKMRDTRASLLEISLKREPKQGAWFDGDLIHVNARGKSFSLHSKEIPLQGKHNMVNVMCAVLTVIALDLDFSGLMESLKTFHNAPHRLEPAGEINGVEYINDSKATNVDSVCYGLDAMRKSIVWIAGGVDKGNDYSVLDLLVRDKVKALVCLGKDNSKLIKAFSGKVKQIDEAFSMEEAVKKAQALAGPGEAVLLSPACASFDLFKNYEDRGNQFKDQVKKIKEGKTV